MSRISVEALCVIDAIARKGSFAAAAEELFRVPSAITYTVQKLERDLDVAIFDRSGHRATLTDAGKRLLDQGRNILRAVAELESDVQRVATGWESELRIAVGELLRMDDFLPLAEQFLTQQTGTVLKLGVEVFGGAWDALESDRVDLVIGAPNDPPEASMFSTFTLGNVPFVFVVAADHPLAAETDVLKSDQILKYRAVAVADTSRNLPPRTAALLTGQKVLTVHSMELKCEAHRRGWGVGYVPKYLVAEDIAAGRLVEKRVEQELPGANISVAWRQKEPGNALSWFLEQLQASDLFAAAVKTDT
jgi:DNA-binding transcriptional LysR family regulator